MTDNRRSRLLIEPRFQIQFMIRLAAWVALATLVTAAVVCVAVLFVQHRLTGDFFYVTPVSGSHPAILTLAQIIIPAVCISLPINLVITLVFALYYSNRLAGPIHRLHVDMLKVARGEKVRRQFSLRGSDEMQEVAHAFDTLLKGLAEKGYVQEL